MSQSHRDVGSFIVFEGAHASGKTLAAKRVVKELRKRGIPAVYTKEPFSKRLKPMIAHSSRQRPTNPVALAFLIAADRSLHLDKISDWLVQGKFVICDRYKLSSFVYQRIDGLDQRTIERINGTFREPDLMYLFVVPAKLRLRRLSHIRRGSSDRFLSAKALREEQRIYALYAL